MDLLEAVKKLNKLNDDVEKLDKWTADLQFGDKENRKPVQGQTWFKLQKAINGVIDEISDEHRELEEKIKEVTKDIKI